jgi:hypothetical protein
MADRFAIVPGPQKASTGSTRQITAGRLTRFSPSGSRPGPAISRSGFRSAEDHFERHEH